MAKTLKKLLVYLLAFQIGISPTLAYAQTGGPGDQNGGNGSAGAVPGQGSQINPADMEKLAQNMASLSDAERAQISPLLDLADKIDAKSVNGVQIPTEDYHLLGKQRIEYLRNGQVVAVADLATEQITRRPEAYNKVNVLYNPATKELIFEGTRGEVQTDEKPRVIILDENNPRKITGEVVARQIIGGVDLKVGSLDNDLVVFLDSKGSLSAINNQFVKTKIFRSPIPVFRKLWSPLGNLDLSKKPAFITFRNRVSQTIDFSKLPNSAVLPRAENGEIILTAGDVVAGYWENGKVEYLGLFNRTRIAEDIHRMSEFAFEVGVLSQANEKMVQSLIKRLERGEIEKAEFEKYVMSMSPLERKALASFDPEALGSMLGSAMHVKKESLGARDQFTQGENLAWASNAARRLKEQYPAPQIGEAAQQAEQPRLNLDRNSAKDLFGGSRVDKLLSASAKFMTSWPTIIAMTASYVALPVAYENYEVLQQMKAISFIYHNLYTDVMKDASYRIVNSKSVLALAAIVPGVILSSAAGGWLLVAAAKASKFSNSLVAQRIRDLAAVWGKMGVFQRIVTMSVRYYALWVYPILRVVLSHALRQKGLFTGLRDGFINPLERVKPDSEVGRKLGLKSSEFVLWNNPLEASVSLAKYLEPLGVRVSPSIYDMTDAKAQAVAQRKEKIQSLLKEQKQRYRRLAWTYAALVVGESMGIDPATLTMSAEDGKSLLDLEFILKDPELAKKWTLIAQETYQNFQELDVLKSNLNGQIDPAELDKMISTARSIGQKLMKSKSAQRIASLKLKFRTMGLDLAKGVSEFSMDKVAVLRNAIPHDKIANMVMQEFILDHAVVVGMPAVVGERADLGNAIELAADPNGKFFTNYRHLFDVAFNDYLHTFISGAQKTLTYYQARVVRETAYDPVEEKLLEIQDRTEPLLKSSYEFVRNLLPDRSDIGSMIVNDQVARIKTVQAGIYAAILFRLVLFHGTPEMVAHQFAFTFFGAMWWWAWIWYPMQHGQMLEEDRMAEIKKGLMDKMTRLSRAIRELDGERSQEAMVEAYRDLLKVYREHSPQVLEKVISLNKNPDIANLDQFKKSQEEALRLKEKMKTPELREAADYFGLLIKLAYAQKANDTANIRIISSQIERILANEVTPEEAPLIRRLSSEALLEFAMQHPPRATKAHPAVSWMATQTAVVVSTYLAIGWGVVCMNPDLLLAPGLIPKWAAIWAGAFAGSYLLLRKEPYDKAIAAFKSFKDKIFGKTAADKAAENSLNEKVATDPVGKSSKAVKEDGAVGVRCEMVFK